MIEIKRFRYYRRLAVVGTGKDCRISLDEVASYLATSKRHARNLLKEMQELRWLHWQPSAGRNRRSLLHLNYSADDLQQQVARRLIEQGSYNQALAFLEDNHSRFGKLLKETSGASNRSGQLHLQLTYPRAFNPLLPHQPQRNSERFFLRQVFASLVHCSPDGDLSPGLAHHWHRDESAQVWAFYLRPGLSFHNDDKIDAHCLVKLFTNLKTLESCQVELEHLIHIEAKQSLCLEFTLSSPDLGFPGLLADTRYAIQPAEQVKQPSLRKVTGSGAFRVSDHNNERLQLEAFADYYHCRALPDEVTIWNVPYEGKELLELTGTGSCQYSLESSQAGSISGSGSAEKKQLECGCIYLLFNHNISQPLTLEQRRWLSDYLHPEQLLQRATPDIRTGIQVALNLLPSWNPVRKPQPTKVPLPPRLDIAVYDQYDTQKTAMSIKQRLEESGVRCTINTYPLATLQCREAVSGLKESLVIFSTNLDDNRPSSAFRWFLSDPLLQGMISIEARAWLRQQLLDIRQTVPLSDYLSKLESLSITMISECWLMPFYHQWQSLHFQDILQDVTMTEWGWPDIREVWMTKS